MIPIADYTVYLLSGLRTFLIYIPRLIDADDDLRRHLERTVAEIEYAFDDTPEILPSRDNWRTFALYGELMSRLDSLKPKIMQVYDYLSDHKVQCYSFIGFSIWKEFADSIGENMSQLIRSGQLSASSEVHIRAISERLDSLKNWSGFLQRRNSYKLIDLWNLVGSVAISAARLSFFCWVKKEGIADDMMVKMVHDLRQMMWIRTPEVLEVYLSAVTSLVGDRNAANSFVSFLLPSDFRMKAYRQGLEFLVMFLMRTSEEEAHQLASADNIKSVIMETATVEYTAREREYYPSRLQFPEKIELLKAEVFLVELLKSSKKAEANSIIPFESLQKGLKSLQNFRNRQQKQDTGKGEQLLTNFKIVISDVESICQANGRAQDGNKDGLKLLLQIKLLKAEVLLMELLKEDGTAFKDQSENLHQGLQILRKFLSRPPEAKSVYGTRILSRIEDVARNASCLHHSFHFGQETQDSVTERNDLLSKLLEEIQEVRREADESFLQVPKSSPESRFPKTNGPGFVDYFSETLKQLLDHEAFPIEYVKSQIHLVLKELESFKSFLKNAAVARCEMNDLLTRIVNLAYEADYVIDSILLRNGSGCNHMAWLLDVIEELKPIKAKAEEFSCEVKTVSEHTPKIGIPEIEEVQEFDVNKCANEVGTIVEKTPKPRQAAVSTVENEEHIVPRPDDENIIKEQLRGTTKSREIVSIVGTGGIGKTTLAKKIFRNRDVEAEFQVRAWGSVSEVYEKRRLLLEIFNYVIELTDQVEKMKDEEIEDLLRKRLSGKKYLIVLDDNWDTRAWNDLVLSFPKEETGSRILITCREHEVASKIKGSNDHYELPLFNGDQSWSLLQKKAFQEKHYPEKLVQLGQRIATDCNGLPLAIVVIADLLNAEKTGKWEEIAKDVSSAAAAKMDILEVSYKHLPEELKSCFLYLGAFQGKKEILARKLVKLWVAEGFIREDDPEHIAEKYLKDLIDRSLVIVGQQKSQGGVKTCRVHSVLSQLCRTKAEKEHFLQLITGFDKHFGAAYDQFKFGDIPNYAVPANPIRYEQHRLSIYSRRNHFAMLKPSGPPVRSLLYFGADEDDPRCPYDMTFISNNFRLLRLLVMESINIRSSFPAGIERLKRLRYLAVSGNIESIPESIANLWNLETFIVKGSTGTVRIDEAIWKMQSLKHFHVGDTAIFSFKEKPRKPTNLVSFSTPYISCEEDTVVLTRILPQVQKLRCKFSKSQGHDSGNHCNRSSPVMSFLTWLQSLSVSYYGGVPYSCEFWFPSTLKKLSLSNLQLPASYISKIASLQALKVLKLLSVVFDKQSWEIEDNFPTLEYLKIYYSGIVSWKIGNRYHLPGLRRLVLRSCHQLQGLPKDFSQIDSLEMIELQRCGQSVEVSAMEIQKQKMYNSQPFKLLIDGQLKAVQPVELLDD